jgi:hypothetical protein
MDIKFIEETEIDDKVFNRRLAYGIERILSIELAL